jgi:hypothetical protein
MVSCFNYLCQGDDPAMSLRVPESERALVQGGFDAFLDRLAPHQLLRQVFTFSAALDVSEAADGVASCSYAFASEAFTTGLAGLAERLELPLVARRERVTSGTAPPTAAQLGRLRELLEPEYELLRRVGFATDRGGST